MQNKFKKAFTFLTIGMTSFTCFAKSQKQEIKRPNIIFIMSDDHSYKAISAYGYNLNKTPNIDLLAKEGAIFTRASVTNALSAPSRAVMLTGKHSFINGKIDNSTTFDWNQDNFSKQLQNGGYQTALVGKIHIDGVPQGFDYSIVLPGQGNYYNPVFIENGIRKTYPGYVTTLTTKFALNWLENVRDKNKPFCLLYHQKAPHRNWMPEKKYYQQYTKSTYKVPETLFDNYEGRGTAAKKAEMNIFKHMYWAADTKIYPSMMDKLNIPETNHLDKRNFEMEEKRMSEEQRASWDSVYVPINQDFKNRYHLMSESDIMNWKYQRYMQDYMATIASIDDGVGEIFNFLKVNGLSENTIIVYTSDQGFFLGEHGWFDKRFMYEESFRTPLIVRYPKEIKPGTKINKLVQNLDFAPTFLDYAGIKIPEDIQGKSFRKLVSGKSDEWRDAAYYTYYEYPAIHMVKRHYGISTERYKIIHFYYDVDEWEMYDLKKDPSEMNNIYNNPEYVDIKKMLHKKLAEIRLEYGDSDLNDKMFIENTLKSKNSK